MTAILNKKILLAASVIVAMTALVLGATYAAWVATASIAGNTVSTAELNITAVGAEGADAVEKPITAENILPDWQSDPAERAIITNNSSMPLDLYYYVELTGGQTDACQALGLAWHAGPPGGDGTETMGYNAGGTWANTQAYEASNFTFTIAQLLGVDEATGLLSLIGNLEGQGNAVKIADASSFEDGEQIAIRELAYFADDADYPTNAGNCEWVEHFEGRIPEVD
jgi:hypothetical protein